MLLSKILVVRMHQHKLGVVCHVIILLYLLLFLSDIQINLVRLDNELRILVDEEWCQVFLFPFSVLCRVFQIIDFGQLHFIISRVNYWLGVRVEHLSIFLVAVEHVGIVRIQCVEFVIYTLFILQFDM